MPEIKHSTEYETFLESIRLNENMANAFIRNSIVVDYKDANVSELTWKHYVETGISSVFVMDISHERWWLEVLLCRNIDAFQYYISQILRQVFVHHPHHLVKMDNGMRGNTDRKVNLREVLEAESIADFIQQYADKKVIELSYLGLPNLVEYINANLGLKFDTKMLGFRDACELVEYGGPKSQDSFWAKLR